ncbi:MAG: gliding motility-associated C-terminal domain-containing protein [Crocinitomicaceae bacterium]
MKGLYLIWISCINFTLIAQNIVPNPSFEDNDSCYTQISNPILFLESADYYCTDWFEFEDSLGVQYFNPCNNFYLSVPQNYIGYSWAKDGDSYIGLVFIQGLDINGEKMDHRGFLSAKLNSPLVKDSAYCISYSFKNSGVHNNYYGIDNIGLLFTSDTLTQIVARTTLASIRTPKTILQYEQEWVTHSGYYIASGDEEFINIGTFGPDSETEYNFEGHNWIEDLPAAYYYFDDIRITQCNKDSIFEVRLGNLPNVFTPNNDGINDQFTFDYHNFKSLTVRVFNRWGTLVTEINGLNGFWDGTSNGGQPVSEGIYYVFVEGEDIYGQFHKKNQMVQVLR